jgi:hypothetical protein
VALGFAEPESAPGLGPADLPLVPLHAARAKAKATGRVTGTERIDRRIVPPRIPIVKVSTSSELFAAMEDDLDLDAGRVAHGFSAADVGKELAALIERVARGEQTKAELNDYEVMAIHTHGPAF